MPLPEQIRNKGLFPNTEKKFLCNHIANLILHAEGGFANLSGDTGGETVFGIASNVSSSHKLAFLQVKKDILNGNYIDALDKTVQFYNINYYSELSNRISNGSPLVKLFLFDYLIWGSPYKVVTKTVQILLNNFFNCSLKVDGIMGDKTFGSLSLVLASNEVMFINQLLRINREVISMIVSERCKQYPKWKSGHEKRATMPFIFLAYAALAYFNDEEVIVPQNLLEVTSALTAKDSMNVVSDTYTLLRNYADYASVLVKHDGELTIQYSDRRPKDLTLSDAKEIIKSTETLSGLSTSKLFRTYE